MRRSLALAARRCLLAFRLPLSLNTISVMMGSLLASIIVPVRSLHGMRITCISIPPTPAREVMVVEDYPADLVEVLPVLNLAKRQGDSPGFEVVVGYMKGLSHHVIRDEGLLRQPPHLSHGPCWTC